MASNNSSKTAHVMNLLSKNRSPEPADTAAPAPDAAPAQETPQAPILTSINEDAAVSSQIKDALEAELSGEAPPAAEPDAGAESSRSEEHTSELQSQR